ncbi:hypothetical protein DdX_19941 [Ditylenchus destructor]|uniref:Uncharacterized protein n=1 Tax=Ditylenchus destructor TaxID=166010 RepID=A0AAD4QS29_9BILA|nr:hypothetical protein DdX_19941 [Ditylenchus destructor]
MKSRQRSKSMENGQDSPAAQKRRRSQSLVEQMPAANVITQGLGPQANVIIQGLGPPAKRRVCKVVASDRPVRLEHSTHYSRGKRMAVTNAGNKTVHKWFEQRRNKRADGTELLNVPQPEYACIALEYNNDHVDVVNRIG